MNPNVIKDCMMVSDSLTTVNKSNCAAPHGRLFQVLGVENGRKIIREISCNTVVVGGAITALENLIGPDEKPWKPATINEKFGVGNKEAASGSVPRLALFGVGTGASTGLGNVASTDIKQDNILGQVPLRYGSIDPNTEGESKKYFMKVGNNTDTKWYLKKFEASPVIKSMWKNSTSGEDGTLIQGDISDSVNTNGIETFVEFTISLDPKDIREYFEANNASASAAYNTIGFYTGVYNETTGEYDEVRLYSAVTFNNRPLDLASSSEFIYRVYSLI